MADQVVLGYTSPETGSAATTTLSVQSVKGWYDFDEIELFPGLQHRYLSGSVNEQIAGLRRIIELDFGVVSTFANRKAILYFLKDSARTINLTIAAPTNPSATTVAGGTLPDDQYFYRVTAVNGVGETTGCTEVNATTSGTDNSVTLDWDNVSGATSYRVYRSDTTATYSGAHFLIEVTSSSYVDTGAVALTSTYQLPSVQSLTVALENFGGYSNEWLGEVNLGRRFKVRLLDQTLRTTLTP